MEIEDEDINIQTLHSNGNGNSLNNNKVKKRKIEESEEEESEEDEEEEEINNQHINDPIEYPEEFSDDVLDTAFLFRVAIYWVYPKLYKRKEKKKSFMNRNKRRRFDESMTDFTLRTLEPPKLVVNQTFPYPKVSEIPPNVYKVKILVVDKEGDETLIEGNECLVNIRGESDFKSFRFLRTSFNQEKSVYEEWKLIFLFFDEDGDPTPCLIQQDTEFKTSFITKPFKVVPKAILGDSPTFLLEEPIPARVETRIKHRVALFGNFSYKPCCLKVMFGESPQTFEYESSGYLRVNNVFSSIAKTVDIYLQDSNQRSNNVSFIFYDIFPKLPSNVKLDERVFKRSQVKTAQVEINQFCYPPIMTKAYMTKPISELVKFRDHGGYTLLHWSCGIGDEKLTRECLSNEFNVNLKDYYGCTPLYWAVWNKNPTIILILLEQKELNINLGNDYGITPLHLAYYFQNEVLIQLLIQYGASNEIKDIYGDVPSLYATLNSISPTISIRNEFYSISQHFNQMNIQGALKNETNHNNNNNNNSKEEIIDYYPVTRDINEVIKELVETSIWFFLDKFEGEIYLKNLEHVENTFFVYPSNYQNYFFGLVVNFRNRKQELSIKLNINQSFSFETFGDFDETFLKEFYPTLPNLIETAQFCIKNETFKLQLKQLPYNPQNIQYILIQSSRLSHVQIITPSIFIGTLDSSVEILMESFVPSAKGPKEFLWHPDLLQFKIQYDFRNIYPNFSSLFGITFFGEEYFIVSLKYIDRLSNLLNTFNIHEQVLIAKKLAIDMQILKEQNVAHLDLTVENIFLYPPQSMSPLKYDIKIGGFRNAIKFLPWNVKNNFIVYSRPRFLSANFPPEFVQQTKANWTPADYFSADIYSFGCVLYEILCKKQYVSVNQDSFSFLNSELDCPPEFIQILKGCLNPNSLFRWSWTEIIQTLEMIEQKFQSDSFKKWEEDSFHSLGSSEEDSYLSPINPSPDNSFFSKK